MAIRVVEFSSGWAPTRRQAARNASADRQTEPIHVSVVGVVQVAALGDDGRCTIYYGPAYNRAYGAANESLLQTEVAQRDLWGLLDFSNMLELLGLNTSLL